MINLIAKKPRAEIYEVKNMDRENDNCIRVYCTQVPDVFHFQIRTFKPITERWDKREGKSRNMVANVSLTITELEEILKYCKSIAPNAKLINTKPLELI